MITRQVQEQFKKIFGSNLHSAISDKGSLRNVFHMYEQAKYRMETSQEKINTILKQLDILKISQIRDFSELMLEYHVVLTLFRMSKMSLYEIAEGYVRLLVLVYGKDDNYRICRQAKEEQELFETVIRIVKNKTGIFLSQEEQKMEKILMLIYEYSSDYRLSIQWLAKQILYINEDYLARIFKTNMKQKMPDYLCKVRMETAKRIVRSNRKCSITELALLTGYQEDGRYFSKVFKKYVGKTLAEYRNKE